MPLFKADGKLVFYAHVPKCGGSSVSDYLRRRFGKVALNDSRYLSQPEPQRWTRSSPQHVDAESLERLIPLDFFDACFTIVRHPVARAVSIYHFEQEVEGRVAADTGFSEWLAGLPAALDREPFAADNHIRPMTEIVPEGAAVFHLEHGLEPLVGWLDAATGRSEGPRHIGERNKRGDYVRTRSARAEPTAADLALIARLYAADFARFGYTIGETRPKAAPPPGSAYAPPRRPDPHSLQQRISRRLRRMLC